MNARFDGYSDKESTDKKILTDVFKKGDRYFNTGISTTTGVNR